MSTPMDSPIYLDTENIGRMNTKTSEILNEMDFVIKKKIKK